MKKIISKKNLAIGISLAVIVLTMAGSVFAFEPAYNMGDVTSLKEKTVDEILVSVINWGVAIASLVCALIIVIAGILWITAAGNDTQLGNARKMLIYGIVGLLVVLGAYALVKVASDFFY